MKISTLRYLNVLFSIFLISISARAQVHISSTVGGSPAPIDGIGSLAHFGGPWQVLSRDSVVYISDKDNGALRRLSLKTKQVTTLFTGQTDIAGIAISSGGDSLFFSSKGNILKMYRFSSQAITTLDTLPEADINALLCTRKGELFIAGETGHRILLRSANGTYKTVAGKLFTSGTADGVDSIARFYNIANFALSKTEDTLFIADRFNSKIRRLARTTKLVSTIPITSGIFGPRQLAFNKRMDTLFIANSSRHTIIRVALKTNQNSIWCGGNNMPAYADGAPSVTRFNYPHGIVRTDSGFVVADYENRRIRLVSFKAVSRTIAGMGRIGNGVGTATKFDNPFDIVKHPKKDSLYITDQYNHVIRIYNLQTGTYSTAAGNGLSGNVLGVGGNALLNRPSNMAMSQTGDSLFFVEQFSNRIKLLLTKTNEVRWLAGSDTAGYVDKVNGRFARFNRPMDISRKGNLLYVSDALNHKIRTINLASTEVKTYAGSTSGFKDSTLLQARFNRPSTLEWVGNRLFVGEDAGLRIRVIDSLNGTVKNWAGSGNFGNIDGNGPAARFKGISKMNFNEGTRALYVGGYLNEGLMRTVGVDQPYVKTLTSFIGSQDGVVGHTAGFLGPQGIWADTANQRVILADAGNDLIRSLRYYQNSPPQARIDTLVNLLEDSPPTTFTGFANDIQCGTTIGDTLQKFAFVWPSGFHPKIQSAAIDTSGKLTIKPAPDSNGVFLMKVVLKDDGGSALGGSDTAIYYTKIRVTPVNDGPFVTTIGDDTGGDELPRISENFITSATGGPIDEQAQTLSWSVSVDRGDRFLVLPYIEGTTLHYTPKPDSLGMVFARLVCRDNGGTELGGVDSTIINFRIFIVDQVSVESMVEQQLLVYPNPGKDKLHLLNAPSDASSVAWYNMWGQEIGRSAITGEEIAVPLGASGICQIRTNGSKPFRTRVMIRK